MHPYTHSIFLETNILTGIFYLWGYGPPPGFCYDALCNDEPIIDNIALEGYNIDERVDQFLKYVKEKVQEKSSYEKPKKNQL